MNELDRRASDAGQQVTSTAGHLRKIAEELRADDLSRPAAQLADRGAQTLEDIGRYLAQSKGDKLLADAERFGRQRPWVLASAGVALGLAGSRMLKASAARRAYNDEYGGSGVSAPVYGVPVSSDAAPGKAATQGVSPVSPPLSGGTYTSSGTYGASGTGSTFDAGSKATNIPKSSEADRLTRGDGT